MKVHRVWRAAPLSLVAVWLFVAAVGGGIPVLVYLTLAREEAAFVVVLLVLLALIGLVYAWRYGVRPRLRADRQGITVINPWRRAAFAWDELTVIDSGENGLVIGADDRFAEAWCVQRSRTAARRGRRTRSDRVVEELFDLWETLRPPVLDATTGLRLRRARPAQVDTLTSLEQASSQARLAHVFPPDQFPYPRADIRRRWARVLRNRHARVWLGEHDGEPVGFVAHTGESLLHLGVHPDYFRRGFGSVLLRSAVEAMRATGGRQARLWVITDNGAARDLYAGAGWTLSGATRNAEYPPYPAEVELVLDLTVEDSERAERA